MSERCSECGAQGPTLFEGRCEHWRACEARQMLALGASPQEAADHAQGRSGRLTGMRPARPEDYDPPLDPPPDEFVIEDRDLRRLR